MTTGEEKGVKTRKRDRPQEYENERKSRLPRVQVTVEARNHQNGLSRTKTKLGKKRIAIAAQQGAVVCFRGEP